MSLCFGVWPPARGAFRRWFLAPGSRSPAVGLWGWSCFLCFWLDSILVPFLMLWHNILTKALRKEGFILAFTLRSQFHHGGSHRSRSLGQVWSHSICSQEMEFSKSRCSGHFHLNAAQDPVKWCCPQWLGFPITIVVINVISQACSKAHPLDDSRPHKVDSYNSYRSEHICANSQGHSFYLCFHRVMDWKLKTKTINVSRGCSS